MEKVEITKEEWDKLTVSAIGDKAIELIKEGEDAEEVAGFVGVASMVIVLIQNRLFKED